ncbi:MAG: MarR family transcriptional regulator [Myxococcaceae bacterium]|nr:MarR family transcriptional regulator [Myxococcaceae bacterium]
MPTKLNKTSSRSGPEGVQLWLLLWRATKAQEAYAYRSIEALGLCLSDFGVMEALLHKGPLPVNTLGKKLLVTSGSMTAVVDRLSSQGLVARKESKEDRRARIVELTATGTALIKRLFAEHARDMQQSFACLSSGERRNLARLLVKLAYRDGETERKKQ